MSLCCIQNLKTLAQIEAEKSVTENFVREKEKWINEGTDKQYVADSLLHSTTCHYQALYQNFKILGQVVPEKSLTENFVKEKAKWTNKGTDKQYVADYLLHSTTCHYQALYQISRS